jgi:predicted AlkP superfamily phosphohydrolase/phosphomutase
VTPRPSVLMLGLDAADGDVVDALVARGLMPNVQRLKQRGLSGALRSPAGHYAGGVWPTFYSGRSVPAHGIFHSKLWRPSRMRIDVASDGWLPARPFWESLPDHRVCIMDVPMVPGHPRAMNGVALHGWGTHDVLARGAWPPRLWNDCTRRYGAPLMPPEDFGEQSARALEELPVALVAATRQAADIAADLLQRERWAVACVVLGAAHRGGHYLWDDTQLRHGRHAAAATRRPVEPGTPPPRLVPVYQELDRAVGALLDAAADRTLVMAFALHGMGPNPGWSDLLPEILARVQQHASGAAPRRGLLYRLKQRTPLHRVRPLLNRLPPAVAHGLVSVWSRRMYDWPATRFFPMPMDEAGYLRVNMRGRERAGVVEPGAQYDALCDELEDLLRGLCDADSGAPIAGTPVRAWADAPADAPQRALLPDLVVPFTGPPASATRRLVSAALPGFAYDVPAVLPSGRSGNHTDCAWFIANGPGVRAGTLDGGADVLDLAPTVLHHLGVPPLPGMEGAPIELGPTP